MIGNLTSLNHEVLRAHLISFLNFISYLMSFAIKIPVSFLFLASIGILTDRLIEILFLKQKIIDFLHSIE